MTSNCYILDVVHILCRFLCVTEGNALWMFVNFWWLNKENLFGLEAFQWIFLVFLGLSGTLEYAVPEWFHWYHAGSATVCGYRLWHSITSCAGVFPSEPYGASPPKANCASLESCIQARDSKHSEIKSQEKLFFFCVPEDCVVCNRSSQFRRYWVPSLVKLNRWPVT